MSRLARITVIVTVAAGIAFLGLLAGGRHQGAGARQEPDAMRGHWPVEMPSYPGAREYPLGQKLQVGPKPMKMSYFMTRDDPLKVANYYIAQWKAAGHHVTEDLSPQGGVVGAYDPASGVLRQILMRRQGSKTAVFPSVMPQGLRPTTDSAAAGTDTPVYPGSEGVLTFGGRDPGHRSRVTLFTNHGGMANNVEFYRSRLPEAGWREVPPKAPSPLPAELTETLTFHKGQRELTINVTRLDARSRVRVHMTEASGQDLMTPPPPTATPELGSRRRSP